MWTLEEWPESDLYYLKDQDWNFVVDEDWKNVVVVWDKIQQDTTWSEEL